MKIKKLVAMVLGVAMLFSLTACGGSKKESLVLYSSMTENDIDNLIKEFNSMYPDINIEVVNGSAGELKARISAEKDNPQGDVMWGGLSNADGDNHKDIFEKWLSDHESEVKDAYKSMNGMYNMDHISTVAFCVNKNLEKELGIEIKGYKDLLNPKLKGKIVFSDPNSSSAAWNNVSNIMSVFGKNTKESWDYIKGLFNNGMVVQTSSSVAFKSVETGEYVVGMTYEDGVAALLKSGAKNIKLVYPAEGTSASALGCAVIKGAKNMKAAKAMVNFLMSKEGQNKLGTALQTLRMTNKNANYTTKYLPDEKDIKWVDRDEKWFMENKKDILKKWNEIFVKNK